MGHLLGKKQTTFLKTIQIHKEEKEEKIIMYSLLGMKMLLLKEASPPILV